MQSKLRFGLILLALAVLLYIHDNPREAKTQGEIVAQGVSESGKNSLTEENVTNVATKTMQAGDKVAKVLSKIIENMFSELGFEDYKEGGVETNE